MKRLSAVYGLNGMENGVAILRECPTIEEKFHLAQTQTEPAITELKCNDNQCWQPEQEPDHEAGGTLQPSRRPKILLPELACINEKRCDQGSNQIDWQYLYQESWISPPDPGQTVRK